MNSIASATRSQRNYGIDFLRMLSMFMIVILHVLLKGGVLNASPELSVNYFAGWFLEYLTVCAVNCYALISGCFGSKSKYRYANIAVLWLRVAIYSVLITVIFMIAMPETRSITQLLRSFLPVFTNEYWYFTSYFLLFFITPVIDIAVKNLPQKQLKYTAVVLTAVTSVIPLILRQDPFSLNKGYSALWLLVLYIVGAYIGKYNAFRKATKTKAFLGYLGFCIINWLIKFIIETVPINRISSSILMAYPFPTIVGAAICLLLLFRQISVTNRMSKVIAVASPLCFSVDLIHTHPLIFDNI